MYTLEDVSLTIDGVKFDGCSAAELERTVGGGTIRFTVEADLTDEDMVKLLNEARSATTSSEGSEDVEMFCGDCLNWSDFSCSVYPSYHVKEHHKGATSCSDYREAQCPTTSLEDSDHHTRSKKNF